MTDKIISLRPRDQVPRRIKIGTFRSDPSEFEARMGLSPRLRVHGSVKFTKMTRAFAAAGLEWKHDKRTNEFVVFPAPESASAEITEPAREDLSAFLLAKRIEKLPRERYYQVTGLVEQLEAAEEARP